MANRPRRQVYTLEGYLKKISDKSVRSDQDVQRLAGQWDSSMVNELIATVLTDNYIPPIILGEQPLNGATQMYIIEGLQRSTSLVRFRYGNYKITSAVENNIATFLKRREDENGNLVMDECGNYIWDTVEYDIKGKTYDMLPQELKDKFNEYQLETVIHEECTMEEMSKLVRRYNNHKAMNPSQKAFTYIDRFAKDIRHIINDGRFFKDCGEYTQKEKENGTLERIISETIMSTFHLDKWQKNTKKMGQYINENATAEEFEKLGFIFERLSVICEGKYARLFNSKNTFIFAALFNRFSEEGLPDARFSEFLDAFETELHSKEIDGVSFDVLDENRATKDKTVVVGKIDFLEKLMNEYFGIEKTEEKSDVEYLAEITGENVEVISEDIDLYNDSLDDLLTDCVKDGSKLLDEENRLSLLAMMIYSFLHNVRLEDWLEDYAKRNNTYIKNSKNNYRIMVDDFNKYKSNVA